MSRLAITQPDTGPLKARYPLSRHLNEASGQPSMLLLGLANSRPVLESFLFMEDALARSTLTPRLRVQIALLVAETNRSRYCLDRHTAHARKLGLSESDIFKARHANAVNIKQCTALKFASGVLAYQGNITDFEFDTLREVGFSDREITEIIACIAFNVFTSYFSNLAQPASDFPQPEPSHRLMARMQ